MAEGIGDSWNQLHEKECRRRVDISARRYIEVILVKQQHQVFSRNVLLHISILPFPYVLTNERKVTRLTWECTKSF